MSEPIDIAHLNEMTEGDVKFLKELLGVYIAETSKLIDQLFVSLSDADFSAVSTGAHSIKGASANIGAVLVVDAAYVVEKLSRELKLRLDAGGSDDPGEIPARIEKLSDEFKIAKEYIQANLL